jgi:membrane fusion protein, copper/silver efflux system
MRMHDLFGMWKKRARWIIPAVVGLIAFTLGWWMSGTNNHDGHAPPAAYRIAEPAGETTARQQLYTCSMHPQIRSTNPDDQCPICGMDLIPVPVDDDMDMDDDGDLPRLRVSPRAAALMQIEVRPVEARPITIPVRLYGRISYDETRLSTISAWIGGRLDRLYVDFTGTAVRRGQPMVEIYSPELITAQQEHLQTLQTTREMQKSGLVRDTLRQTVDASRDRLRLLGLGKDQIERLEKQGRVDDRLVIPAPSSGIVIERLASTGDYLQTGAPIYRLADMSHLWVLLEVYESDLQWLELGQQALFSVQSYPGERFEGKVTFIDPILNERTRTVRVRVEVPNPDGRLKPGMFVRGAIEAGVAQVSAAPGAPDDHAGHGDPDATTRETPPIDADTFPLVIPASAPLITGERAIVYVQNPTAEQPTFEPREIVLGPRAGPWRIVREGLIEGELVVTHGAFKIDAELQIRGRPSMMQPEGGPPPVHDHGDAGSTAAAPGEATGPAVGAPPHFQAQLGRLVIANFDMVAALAADDPEAAQRAALNMDAALHDIDATRLTLNAHRRQWNRLAKTLHDTVLMLATSPDLDEQRGHFQSVSDTLIELVRVFGIAQTGPVYLVMCPMVEGGQGFWLQSQRAITNPYFGVMMLTCGEIQETIAEADDPHGGH